MKVKFRPSARSQFLSALQYIRQHSPLAAAQLRVRAERALRRLGPHPQSGRRVPEFPELPHREVVLAPYRFFYRVEGKTVWIMAVWHGAQLPALPSEPAPAEAGGQR